MKLPVEPLTLTTTTSQNTTSDRNISDDGSGRASIALEKENSMTQGKTTILLVDDTLVNLKLLSSVLTRQNYVVRAALNGAIALRLVESSPPDLILLDIAMPEM